MYLTNFSYKPIKYVCALYQNYAPLEGRQLTLWLFNAMTQTFRFCRLSYQWIVNSIRGWLDRWNFVVNRFHDNGCELITC